MERRRSIALFALLFCLGIFVPLGASLAETRVALVIGNANYKNTPTLDNPGNDATDVAQALAGVGFAVTLRVDATKRQMDQAIAQFARDAKKADAALFYYAGHGMQFQGRNFVMPVDAELQDEISLRYELTAIDDVKAALQSSNGVKILVLDSCRNNPLADKLVRSISATTRDIPKVQGFARAERTSGMIIVYATQSDDVANDGAGRNSPFSGAFLKELKEPGLEVGTLFRRVEDDVFNATNGRQSPELSISMVPEYYLNQAETDQSVWARIRSGADAATLREFLTRYPNSFYAPDAAARLDLFERQERERADAEKAKKTAADAGADAGRLKQQQAERDRAAAEAHAREQELSAKLAAAETERAKLGSELSQREAEKAQAEAQQRAEREKAEQDRAQREASLRAEIARAQASEAEKARLLQEALDKERAKTAASDKDASDRERVDKANAEREAKAEEDRAQALKAETAQLEQQAALARANAESEAQKAADARKAADAAEQKVAAATPEPVNPSAAAPPASQATLPLIRAELRRIGCYTGGDLDWSAPEMKLGVAKYVRYANLAVAPAQPDAGLLEDMKKRRDGLCPPECSAREVVVGGRCVAKTCGRDETLTRTGACVAKPAPRAVAARALVAPAAPRPAAAAKGHCFNFNGNEYCE